MDSYDNMDFEKFDAFLNEHSPVSSKKRMIRGKVPAIGLNRTARAVRPQRIFGPKPQQHSVQPRRKRRKWVTVVASIFKRFRRKN